MTFGEKLQLLRKQKGLSQEELADKLDVSRQAISKWELGSSLPETQKVLQISRVFDVSCDYLMRDEVEQGSDRQEPRPTAPARSYRAAALTMLVGALGILAFWILSAVYPAETRTAVAGQGGETVKTGLAGFLDYHNMELLFALCCVVLAVGALLLAYNYMKNKKTV